MNEPTNRDILTTVRDVLTAVHDVGTAVGTLDRELHLFRDVTEARFGLMGERFDRIDDRFDTVELRQKQHGQALKELSAGANVQSASLDRIECSLKAATESLSDHERRIKALEPRR